MQQIITHDKLNNKITIECETIELYSEHFPQKMQSIGVGLASAYTPVELEFAKQFPHSVAQDKFLQSVAPHFKEGVEGVDWPQVEMEIKQTLEKFFTFGFQKSLSANKEMKAHFTHHLLIAKEGVNPIGALYCMMAKEDAERVVRVPLFAINPEAQSRGIGKSLMGAVLKHIPDCKKIALSTRVTNHKAIKAYQQWGFTPVPNTMEQWVNLEYSVDSAILR